MRPLGIIVRSLNETAIDTIEYEASRSFQGAAADGETGHAAAAAQTGSGEGNDAVAPPGFAPEATAVERLSTFVSTGFGVFR